MSNLLMQLNQSNVVRKIAAGVTSVANGSCAKHMMTVLHLESQQANTIHNQQRKQNVMTKNKKAYAAAKKAMAQSKKIVKLHFGATVFGEKNGAKEEQLHIGHDKCLGTSFSF